MIFIFSHALFIWKEYFNYRIKENYFILSMWHTKETKSIPLFCKSCTIIQIQTLSLVGSLFDQAGDLATLSGASFINVHPLAFITIISLIWFQHLF